MKIQCYEKFIADQSAGSIAVSVQEEGDHSVTRAVPSPSASEYLVLLNSGGQGLQDRLILGSLESFF